MDAKLQIVSGKASKDVIALKLPVVIGRGRDAGLTIAHPLVSRQHCRLYESEGVLMLEDLGSTNGTFLDGRRIRQAALPPESEFSIGPLTFRALYDYAGDLSALPDPVFADQSETPSVEEVTEFEVLDEDVDFLLADDDETKPEPTPAAGTPSPPTEAETAPEDLLETTSLPTAQDETPSPKTPGKTKPSAPKPKPSSEQPADEITDEEFEKFFDDL
ncbi:MAG: FHA domain-containing protein [Pirellulales bacterium]|nr:FHA domain-containing protein [Pirellulales bacterium]